MIPSSKQWTMIPSADILVYPISRYVITPTTKLQPEWHRVQSTRPTIGVRPSRHKTFQYFQGLDIAGRSTAAISRDYGDSMDRPVDSDSRSSSGSTATSSPDRSSRSPPRRSDHLRRHSREWSYRNSPPLPRHRYRNQHHRDNLRRRHRRRPLCPTRRRSGSHNPQYGRRSGRRDLSGHRDLSGRRTGHHDLYDRRSGNSQQNHRRWRHQHLGRQHHNHYHHHHQLQDHQLQLQHHQLQQHHHHHHHHHHRHHLGRRSVDGHSRPSAVSKVAVAEKSGLYPTLIRTENSDGAPSPNSDYRDGTRCSANVVLLAHGNRSLHVLTIQRSQTTTVECTLTPADATAPRRSDKVHHQHHNYKRTTSSTTVVRYKLPGGQLMLTDDEKENYKQEDRNTCTCPDDRRWYTAALGYFTIQFPAVVVSPSLSLSLSSSSGPPAATDDTAEDSSLDLEDQQDDFVLIGKWYRTQDKETRELWSAGDHSNNPQCYYYPYIPAHVSRQTVEHKRVYAVPDARRLFSGPSFDLRAPRAKTKIVPAAPDCTAAVVTTRTTTYKCKFVPLARLHENNRLYGPVLSSLPAVLSSMNLICLQ